jgi:hypothetical protein
VKKFTIYWINGGAVEVFAEDILHALRRVGASASNIRFYEVDGKTVNVAGQATCDCPYNEDSNRQFVFACSHDLQLAGIF